MTVRARRTLNFESTARIPILFAVESNIEEVNNLTWRTNATKIVYIHLKACVQNYSSVENTAELNEL